MKEENKKEIKDYLSKQDDFVFMIKWLDSTPAMLRDKYKGDNEKLERLEYMEGVVRDRIKELTS